MKCVSFVAWSVLESLEDFAKSHRVAANNIELLPFLAQQTEAGSKPSAVKMLWVHSVLPSQWSWAFSDFFQVTFQNQNGVLEEVATKILPSFPTVLPLFIVSITCCSSTVVVQHLWVSG